MLLMNRLSMTVAEQTVVQFDVFLDLKVCRVFRAGNGPALLPHRVPKWSVFEKLANTALQVLGIFRTGEVSCDTRTNQIRNPANVKRNHRRTASHAFEQHVGQTFATRWQHKQISRRINQCLQALSADKAERQNGHVERVRERFAALTKEDENDFRLECRGQTPKRSG